MWRLHVTCFNGTSDTEEKIQNWFNKRNNVMQKDFCLYLGQRKAAVTRSVSRRKTSASAKSGSER